MDLPLAVKIGDSLQKGFDAFFNFLPNLLAFVVILVIGFIVAKIVQAVVSKVLEKVGMDRALHQSDAGGYVEKVLPGASPSKGIGKLVFWLIFLFVLVAAIGALKIPAVTAFMNMVLAYLPKVIAALVILVLAGAIAGAVGGLVHRTMGDTPTGKLVRAAVPGLVMAIAVFMVLNQLQIAKEIVTITYAALLGSLALGMALAFGLGGRQLAGEMLRDAYDRGQQEKDQVKDDLETGKERGRRDAERAQQRAGVESGGSGGGGSTQVREQPAPGGGPPEGSRPERGEPGGGAYRADT